MKEFELTVHFLSYFLILSYFINTMPLIMQTESKTLNPNLLK
ncbi:hypothetical protein CLOSTMETH_00473 [[Clostridium] methylpentosum DSM 5476]|uniref:Uncharacterized protein n=1 Tax=[Clostridium] methylpentosum DSM 5476 TaxID=537013 RepID=C0E9H4_9FIRM|nr:hypothetical protein CLOSTMETH_00473 [[Clostridium] methylpentosum DSM 5476]